MNRKPIIIVTGDHDFFQLNDSNTHIVNLKNKDLLEKSCGDPKKDLSDCIRDLVEQEIGYRPEGSVCLPTHLSYSEFSTFSINFFPSELLFIHKFLAKLDRKSK